MQVNYLIIFVSDMKRSVSFYRDLLQLQLKFESPQWSEFVTGGAAIALHISEENNPAISKTSKNTAGQCRPGLGVDNLNDFHKRMVEKNVPCVQEPKEVFGAPIAQYLDPDGLVLSVSEYRKGK